VSVSEVNYCRNRDNGEGSASSQFKALSRLSFHELKNITESTLKAAGYSAGIQTGCLLNEFRGVSAEPIFSVSYLLLNETLYVSEWGQEKNAGSRGLKNKTNSVACSPQANYTDRATAACRRNYRQPLRKERERYGQSNGSHGR
jgi:hypothetical protein